MSSEITCALDRAAEAIATADALLVTAGAGIGVDSGLPDFRGNQGFWRAYPPLERLGISFVDMANPIWFSRNPELAWGFYGHRLGLYRTTEPHDGFQVLRRWSEGLRGGCWVFTSNVDGQFQKAGFDADRIVECHGSIHHIQCLNHCGEIFEASSIEVVVDPVTFRAAPPLPTCPRCGALARPNVLMFGDWGWLPERTTAQERRFGAWLDGLGDLQLVIVEIGAGTAVPTIRMTSEQVAGRRGRTLIRINLRESQVRGDHVGIAMGAQEALSAIAARITGPGGETR
jgi:NAD-dependent SIR2 family protein deacetylase